MLTWELELCAFALCLWVLHNADVHLLKTEQTQESDIIQGPSVGPIGQFNLFKKYQLSFCWRGATSENI